MTLADLDNAAPAVSTGTRARSGSISDVKHVLSVNDFSVINGGQAKVAVDAAVLFAERGIPVTFFAGTGPTADELKRPGIEVICLDQPDILSDENRLRAMRRGIWNGDVARALRELSARFDPKTTVLHCHGYAKSLSPAIGPVLADGPLPSVYTMHEYFMACPNGGFYDFQANEICTRKPLGMSCLTTNCDVRKPIHKAWRVARQVATWGPGRLPRALKDVIYISETQRRVMAPMFGPETRLHHVPNPMPSMSLPRVNRAENDAFVFVGRLNPEKGGVLFAEAAAKLGIRAVFVGDGAEADAIRRVNPDAEMLGWLKPDQVQEQLAQAKALVFPSLWYEGFPLVPLEALSRGVPVVAGAWSAASEAVEDGVNGTIYTDTSVEALMEAMRRVDDLADEGIDLQQDLSLDRHFDDLLRVYKSL